MAEAHYEITYIIKPDMEEDAKKALIDRFDKIITDNGAKVIDSKDWEKKRLAYEIANYKEGIYHIINVDAENDEAINEFDRLSKIEDNILRHMIVRRED
ncbi:MULTISPECIES: 30S ribosomal protein S6 [Companilactobacillus]|jgi:small subunit ribosomal protein S6|uniref:Small ribosomal subunit protein bS6 n=1 Tax=Companilactobacillus pabuli TaxID=2714036 RepID=A0A7L7KZC8_9LACO|nr:MULTISPECIES: 30S ribosomal protein S6 [Companilactobacillus]AKP02885.1 30S ribosomal protein S6 [Companilactobacillus farciminis]AKS51185.1 30S ribosomal protein S6 [Companilactobacillus farciminis]MDG5111953.1 30S ribosomal protein S6 [Companilactobacillus pabuli]QMT85070.1 30S ribosomal protein S6 [Companilactobacillus pabuli]GAQ02080.1 30S ribosomal protein S6 [Companilactobacillus farciminis]